MTKSNQESNSCQKLGSEIMRIIDARERFHKRCVVMRCSNRDAVIRCNYESKICQ